MIAKSYSYVYVAQVAMGASQKMFSKLSSQAYNGRFHNMHV